MHLQVRELLSYSRHDIVAKWERNGSLEESLFDSLYSDKFPSLLGWCDFKKHLGGINRVYTLNHDDWWYAGVDDLIPINNKLVERWY